MHVISNISYQVGTYKYNPILVLVCEHETLGTRNQAICLLIETPESKVEEPQVCIIAPESELETPKSEEQALGLELDAYVCADYVRATCLD
jgi:hypothetical protein